MQIQAIPSVRSSRKPRVAAYIRVSSLGRDQDESFENQAIYFEQKIIQATRYIKDHHEGIVSRGLWERVQRRLEANKK